MQPATEIACRFDIFFLRRERKTPVADTGVLSVLVYHRATRGGCPLGNARRRFFHWRLAPFPFTGRGWKLRSSSQRWTWCLEKRKFDSIHRYDSELDIYRKSSSRQSGGTPGVHQTHRSCDEATELAHITGMKCRSADPKNPALEWNVNAGEQEQALPSAEESKMDRTRLLLIGIVALVLSAALSYVVYQRLQAKMAPQKVGVDVVVAANDIQIGAKIADRDLKVVKYPPEDLPPRVFHTKTSALGRGTVLPIGKGEFVVPDKLAAENAGAGRLVDVDCGGDARRGGEGQRCYSCSWLRCAGHTGRRARHRQSYRIERTSDDDRFTGRGRAGNWPEDRTQCNRRTAECLRRYAAGFSRRLREAGAGQSRRTHPISSAQPARHQPRESGGDKEAKPVRWRDVSTTLGQNNAGKTGSDAGPGAREAP